MQFLLRPRILLNNALVLLPVVRKSVHIPSHLDLELVKLLIPLLNLLIQSLILNLELLVINQVQSIGQLFLLSKYLLLVCKLVSQSDVLQSVLIHLLVLGLICLFPLLDHLDWKLLASSAVLGIHSDTLLQFLELLLDLHAFLLLLVQFVLKFTGHSVVPLLSLLEIVTNLMDVGQGVEILVLVEHLVSLLLGLFACVLHQDDLLLEFLILSLQFVVLVHLIVYGLDELSLHDWLGWQISNRIVIAFFIGAIVIKVFHVLLRAKHALTGFACGSAD